MLHPRTEEGWKGGGRVEGWTVERGPTEPVSGEVLVTTFPFFCQKTLAIPPPSSWWLVNYSRKRVTFGFCFSRGRLVWVASVGKHRPSASR